MKIGTTGGLDAMKTMQKMRQAKSSNPSSRIAPDPNFKPTDDPQNSILQIPGKSPKPSPEGLPKGEVLPSTSSGSKCNLTIHLTPNRQHLETDGIFGAADTSLLGGLAQQRTTSSAIIGVDRYLILWNRKFLPSITPGVNNTLTLDSFHCATCVLGKIWLASHLKRCQR